MNAFPTKDFQQAFFDELELQFPKRGQMVNAISDLLNVGRDAVYRRLRGDTVLSADELMMLARKYGINLDQENSVKPTNPQLTRPTTNWALKSELEHYQQVQDWTYKIFDLPDVRVDFATSELPAHYEFGSPTLFAFKVYVYTQTAWGQKKWKGQEFRPELLDPKVYEVVERLNKSLYAVPGREVWSVGILDVTLRQIEHCVEVGAVRNIELIEKLFAEIEEIILHMEAMTACGKRFAPGGTFNDDSPDFKVYNNELMANSNAVLVKSRDFSIAYTALVNPNFLQSQDEVVIDQIESWINNLIEGSNVLSSHSGNYASKFFLRLRRSVAVSKQRVEAMVLVH